MGCYGGRFSEIRFYLCCRLHAGASGSWGISQENWTVGEDPAVAPQLLLSVESNSLRQLLGKSVALFMISANLPLGILLK